jgi:hypothetical protein
MEALTRRLRERRTADAGSIATLATHLVTHAGCSQQRPAPCARLKRRGAEWQGLAGSRRSVSHCAVIGTPAVRVELLSPTTVHTVDEELNNETD